MRKSTALHQWLFLTWCAFALLSPGASPRLISGPQDESTDRGPTTDPYNNEQDTATDSTDLSLNFESVTPGDESFESTTTNGNLGPGAAKSGRYFGGRLGGKNSSSNRNNVVFPALRNRPTTPVIAYNYNRIVKRRKNPLVNSTYMKGWNGTVEIASGPPPETTTTEEFPASRGSPLPAEQTTIFTRTTTTSQNPLLSRRKTLAELRNSRPTQITISDQPPQQRSTAPIKTTVQTEPEIDTETEIATEPESSKISLVEASPIKLSPSESVHSIFEIQAQPVSHRPVSLPTNLFVPHPAPEPSFEYNNPSVTSQNGIYHFRYTSTLPTSSRVVNVEEFGITRDTYGDEEEDPTITPEDQQEEPPTTWRSTSYFPQAPGRATIQGSEEDFPTPTHQAPYRNYYPESRPGPGLNKLRFEEQHPVIPAVNATNRSGFILSEASRISSLSTSGRVENPTRPTTIGIDETTQSRPTPTLPYFVDSAPPTVADKKVDQSTQDTDAIVTNSSSSNNAISQEEPLVENHHNHHHPNHDFHGNPNGVFLTSSSRVSVNGSVAVADNKDDISNLIPNSNTNSNSNLNLIQNSNNTIAPTPTISSREFKSTYFTSQDGPLYTVSSYSYSSSSEYSFFVPEEHPNHHGHSQDHDNTHHQHSDVQGDHDHENETDDQQHLDDPKQKEPQELRPTTSTISYWDTLGLKSVDATSHLVTKTMNDSIQEDSNVSSYSPSPSPAGDLESSYSTPQAKTSALPPLTTPRTLTPNPSSSSEENDLSSYFEDGGVSTEAGDREHPDVNLAAQLPGVPFVIQIWLDMQASMFCNRVPIFKDMIVMVYRDYYSNVSSDQVVIFNEPSCSKISNSTGLLSSSLIALKNSSSTPSPSLSPSTPTITNSQQNLSNSTAKKNRTKRTSSHENGTAATSVNPQSKLYSIYMYISDKNGSYDPWLTEAFIDFWNNSSRSDGNNTFFNKIKKVEMISSLQSVTGHAPTNENTGIIVAITVASIAAVCLLVIGVLLLVMRHRQAQTKFAKRCTPVTLDDYSLDNISVFNSFRRKQRTRASKRSYTNAGFEDHNAPSKPLNAMALLAFNPDISTLSDEFSLIPNVNPTLDDIPNGAETKNRFANVIPMPDSRVLLTFQDEQPNSDYINANFARGGSNANKAYIITQGPLDETIVDFWRMIWEQQVRVIFMLTDFAEAGIPRCAEYYPRSETIDCSQLHGDFQITLEKRDVTENCITSNLVIKDMERSLRRDVVHLWYHSWPEKGVPAHPKNTADFLIRSRKYTKEPCPIVVHCSPGTGRSGTVLACDIGMKELETLHTVDIPQIVKKLRQDRAGAVQTKEQYKHIYEVLQYYASKLSSTQLDSV